MALPDRRLLVHAHATPDAEFGDSVESVNAPSRRFFGRAMSFPLTS